MPRRAMWAWMITFFSLALFALPPEGKAQVSSPILEGSSPSPEPSAIQSEKGRKNFSQGPVYWEEGLHVTGPWKHIQVKIGGTLMADGGRIGSDEELRRAFPDLAGEKIQYRRAQLNVGATIYDSVDFFLSIDFARVQQIKDNWIGLHNKIPILGFVRVGHMKEPFSLENLTSSNDLTFMERSLPTEAFVAGRNVGILVQNIGFGERMTWAAGGFLNTGSFGDVGEARDKIRAADGYNLTARVTGLPWYEASGQSLLHLGIAYSRQFRNAEDPDQKVRFTSHPESYLTDNQLVDTGAIRADKVDLLGAEVAIVQGPLSFQGEFFYAATDAPGKPHFGGGYVYGSFFLTGEHRSYNMEKGVFSRLKPNRDFQPFRGEWGAWEVGARFSYVDLNSGGIQGGKQANLTAGLNWYLTPHIRLMANYIHIYVKDRASPAVENGRADIWQARFQISY